MDDNNKNLLSVSSTNDGVHVVKLVPRQILDELQIAQIGQEIKSLIEAGMTRLVLDFSNVDHLSSSALGMLITVKKQLDENDGSIKLCYIRSQILKVFKITRLDEVFAIYKTDSEALYSYNQ